MTVQLRPDADNWNRSGFDARAIRVAAGNAGGPDIGPGWQIVRQSLDNIRVGNGFSAECLLLDSSELSAFSVDELARAGLPIVLALRSGDTIDPEIADAADGFVFWDDDAAVMATVFAGVTLQPGLQVRDLSDGTARTINALSVEAGRIADALARLAETQSQAPPAEQPIDALLVRRLLKVRRDRDRFFPAEIFADPAWDMLLDLTAARLEGKTVPVSSLCIAAAVPTTTALRWIRSLTEAGLFERQTDPADARRTWISLSSHAAAAMLAYLRGFAGVFSLR